MNFIRKHPLKVIAGLILTALAVWAYLHRSEFSRESVVEYGTILPPVAFVAAFLVLPLLGFPISVFLLLAGIRFGLWGGMAVSGAAIICHHFAAYPLARKCFRGPLQRRLEKWGHKIPTFEGRREIGFTALFAAVHGPPYIAKLYLLALTDVSFRIYLMVGAPVYILFCLIPVAAGSSVSTMNPVWIYVALGGVTVMSLLGPWLKKRFSDQTKMNSSED